MTRNLMIRLGMLALILLLSGSMVQAEDVEKKFRLGFSFGGYSTQDKVKSDSANQLLLLDEDEVPFLRLNDPRNDDAALGDLKIKATQRYLLSAQYAVNKILILEGAVGYQKGDVGDIEIQAQYNRVLIPQTQDFLFSISRVEAGTLEQIPIQLTAMARFRPRASFNPFLGAGIGYTLIGFEPSTALDELSQRMDASLGQVTGLVSDGGNLDTSGSTFDLEGAEVLAPDTFEWHLTGGAEYSFKRKWAAYIDLRYVFASRNLSIRFNRDDQLGVSVPQGTAERDDPEAVPGQYGGISISTGGLVDGGQLVPTDPNVPEDQWADYCSDISNQCNFQPIPDGEVDPGIYYVRGGDIKYGGFALGLGIRWTF